MPKTSVIIGAGIVGLHMAAALRQAGHDVFLLEKEGRLGDHSSGRNSGVIHAGIFYPPGSLKEKTCLEGNRLSYEWLRKLKVEHRSCGKWVVPEPGQENQIEPFFEKVCHLDLPKPKLLNQNQLKEQEPQLRPLPAIAIPTTGIMDAAHYLRALSVYLENQGVHLLTHCEVQEIQEQVLKTSRGELPFDLAFNCAGLHADRVAKSAGIEDYEIKPCRGDYYVMNKAPLTRPVYHLPYQKAQGLGVHLTPTLDGQTLIGPNAFFIEGKEDYRHHSTPEAFAQALAFYLSQESPQKIQEAYAGNRPKLFQRGKPVKDFTLLQKGPWIHFLGIESPGLTAAPALARLAVQKI